MAVAKKARTDSGLSEYTGTWGALEVLHLLRRAQFGATKEDLDYFKGKTMSQAVEEILNIDYTPPSPPINNYNNPPSVVDPTIASGSTWINDYNGTFNAARVSSYKRWWIGQMINQDRTIRENMVLFWHNHFSTESSVYVWANFGYNQNAMLRKNCLKNFRTLVKEMTLDAGMLVYLNGERNSKQAPDENYSRELQELFTLGKGPDSNYLEADVIEAAKVLTGWRVNRSDGSTFFDPNRHDTSNKSFSTFYNDTSIIGKTGPAGADELDELITMILNQNEVAKYIARRIYRWFVYYDIDEATEQNVITPMADIFRNSGYEIKPMMTALFKSEHFFDVANRGALIKSPVNFLVGLVRQFDISGNSDFPGNANYVEQYYFWYLAWYYCSIQQQNVGDPPSVAGWPAYYQIPMFHEIWINSDTLPNRNEVSDYLINFGYSYNGFKLAIDPVRFAEKFTSVADPDDFINELLQFLHTLDVADAQKEFMKSILLSGQTQDYYWTNAWNDYINDPSNNSKKAIVRTRLKPLIKYMMNLAEYQLS